MPNATFAPLTLKILAVVLLKFLVWLTRRPELMSSEYRS